MISFDKIGSDGRDGTARYYANIDYEYTVDEFIKTVLAERENEWGEIIVKNSIGNNDWQNVIFDNTNIYSCEYAYGRLKSKLEKKILKQNIVCIWAYGGYSFMNYIVIIDKSTSS